MRRLLLWLDRPDLSINEVALQMGFTDPSAFHRSKKWTGQTPGQFRAESPPPRQRCGGCHGRPGLGYNFAPFLAEVAMTVQQEIHSRNWRARSPRSCWRWSTKVTSTASGQLRDPLSRWCWWAKRFFEDSARWRATSRCMRCSPTSWRDPCTRAGPCTPTPGPSGRPGSRPRPLHPRVMAAAMPRRAREIGMPDVIVAALYKFVALDDSTSCGSPCWMPAGAAPAAPVAGTGGHQRHHRRQS